jgi:hypothetical protein
VFIDKELAKIREGDGLVGSVEDHRIGISDGVQLDGDCNLIDRVA